MTFDNLNLHPAILKAVQEEGYSTPTPIQAEAIPAVLEGHDLLAAAQTGTGKTAGFTLPMLHKLMDSKKENRRKPRALILTPTRELAAQVEKSVINYGKNTPLKSAVIFGGMGMMPQIKRLKIGIDIIVATPGRLLDHINQGNISLDLIEIFVLDEADRMLDMGFIDDINRIIGMIPNESQRLLFSATFSREIKELSKNLLRDPKLIEVARENSSNERIDQKIHPVDYSKKADLLSHLINENNWKMALVFTKTKRGADRLSDHLSRDGIRSNSIHGDKTQRSRTRVLEDFKRGRIRILVATDVAARGIDINHLPHVVNFDLPEAAEDYVHRIGRTGRAGNSGEAISFVSKEDRGLLVRIEKLIEKKLELKMIDGFYPSFDMSAPAEEIKKRSRNRRPSSRGGFNSRSRSSFSGDRDRRDGDRRGFSGNRDDRRDRDSRGESRDRREFRGDRESRDRREFRGDRESRDRRDGDRRDFRSDSKRSRPAPKGATPNRSGSRRDFDGRRDSDSRRDSGRDSRRDGGY